MSAPWKFSIKFSFLKQITYVHIDIKRGIWKILIRKIFDELPEFKIKIVAKFIFEIFLFSYNKRCQGNILNTLCRRSLTAFNYISNKQRINAAPSGQGNFIKCWTKPFVRLGKTLWCEFYFQFHFKLQVAVNFPLGKPDLFSRSQSSRVRVGKCSVTSFRNELLKDSLKSINLWPWNRPWFWLSFILCERSL